MSTPTIHPVIVDQSFLDDPASWFVAQAKKHNLRYLLAHADDGVIWGRVERDMLLTSHHVAPQYSPELRTSTLQQCRLFSSQGELLLWHDEGSWRARLVMEGESASHDSFEEEQILWGTHIEETQDGFSLVREGAQGLRQAIPIRVTPQQVSSRQLRLVVRHFIEYNQDGEARVALSRLVALRPVQD